MKRISLLTLIFALASVIFIIVLVFIKSPFTFYPLMSWQDALDLLTPLVLIPISWTLLKRSSNENPPFATEIAFMVLAAVWVIGQGMHLAANSIDNLIGGLAKSGELDITGSTIFQLTYFIDEHLSHYFWHLGVFGLAALLIYHEWRRPSEAKTVWWMVILAGLIYGFTTFSMTLEGQTLPIGIPFAVLVPMIILVFGLKSINSRPLRAFFLVTYLVTLLLLVIWIIWQGFPIPQFSEAGII